MLGFPRLHEHCITVTGLTTAPGGWDRLSGGGGTHMPTRYVLHEMVGVHHCTITSQLLVPEGDSVYRCSSMYCVFLALTSDVYWHPLATVGTRT
jgi:hypothetical protein